MNGGGGAERLRSGNKCLELDPAASRQWNSIRRAECLATDTDVARLLLSQYRGPGCEEVCQRCSAPLPRVCTNCHSHQLLAPSTDRAAFSQFCLKAPFGQRSSGDGQLCSGDGQPYSGDGHLSLHSSLEDQSSHLSSSARQIPLHSSLQHQPTHHSSVAGQISLHSSQLHQPTHHSSVAGQISLHSSLRHQPTHHSSVAGQISLRSSQLHQPTHHSSVAGQISLHSSQLHQPTHHSSVAGQISLHSPQLHQPTHHSSVAGQISLHSSQLHQPTHHSSVAGQISLHSPQLHQPTHHSSVAGQISLHSSQLHQPTHHSSVADQISSPSLLQHQPSHHSSVAGQISSPSLLLHQPTHHSSVAGQISSPSLLQHQPTHHSSVADQISSPSFLQHQPSHQSSVAGQISLNSSQLHQPSHHSSVAGQISSPSLLQHQPSHHSSVAGQISSPSLLLHQPTHHSSVAGQISLHSSQPHQPSHHSSVAGQISSPSLLQHQPTHHSSVADQISSPSFLQHQPSHHSSVADQISSPSLLQPQPSHHSSVADQISSPSFLQHQPTHHSSVADQISSPSLLQPQPSHHSSVADQISSPSLLQHQPSHHSSVADQISSPSLLQDQASKACFQQAKEHVGLLQPPAPRLEQCTGAAHVMACPPGPETLASSRSQCTGAAHVMACPPGPETLASSRSQCTGAAHVMACPPGPETLASSRSQCTGAAHVMACPPGPETLASSRSSQPSNDGVGRRTLHVKLKRCDPLLDASGTASITPQADTGSLGRKQGTLQVEEGAPVTKTDVDICSLNTNMHSAVLRYSQSRTSSDVSQDNVCLCVKADFEFIAKAEQNQSNSFDPHMGQDTKCEILRQEPASEGKKRNWALEDTVQAALFSDIIEPESVENSVPQNPTGNADRLSDLKSYLKQNEALKQSKSPTATNSSSSSTSTSTSTRKVRRQDSSLTFSIHRSESSMAARENTMSSSQEHAEQDPNLKPPESSGVEVSHTEQDTNLTPSKGSGVEVSHTEQDTNLTPSEGSGVKVSHTEQDTNLTPSEGSGVEVYHTEQDTNLTRSECSGVEVSHTKQNTNLTPSEGSGVEVSHTEQNTNLTPSEGSGVEVSHTEQDTDLTPSEGSGVEVSHTEQDANLKHSKSNGFDVAHRRGRSRRGTPVSYADCDSESLSSSWGTGHSESLSSSWGTGHSDVDTDTDMQSTEDEQSPQQSLSACWPDTSRCEQDQLALCQTGQTDAFQAQHKSAQQHLQNKADMAAPHVTDTEREQHVGNSSVVSSPLRESGTRGQAPVMEMMSSALNEVTSTEVQQNVQPTRTLMSAPLSKKGKRGQESAIETMNSTVKKGLHTEEKQPVKYLYETVTPTSLEEISDTVQQPADEGEGKSRLPSDLQTASTAAQDSLECEPQASASSQGCQATDERTGKCKSPTVLPAKAAKPQMRKQKSKGSPSHQAKGNGPAESDSYFQKCPKCCVSLRTRSKEAAYHHIETRAQCSQCSAMLTSLCDIRKHKQRHAKEDPKTKDCRVLYFCNFCSKTYKVVNGSFLEHIKRHLQSNGFYTSEQEDSQCDLGETTITSTYGARCEQCGLSYEPEQNNDGAKRDVTENRKCPKCRTMCPTCLLCMINGSDLATHQDTNIVGQCTVCNSLHTSLCRIRNHKRTHEQEMEAKRKGLMRYLCNMCDRKYMCWKSLRIHRKSHAAERSHRCDQCPKTFYIRAALNMHLKMHQGLKKVQPKEKNYQCEVCGKRFATPSILAGHLNLHSGQRPFNCDTCEATLTSKHNLLRHKRIHRPLVKQTYQCPQCPAVLSSRNRLRIHVMRHKPEQDLPYGCSVCRKRFCIKAVLETHMHTHTGEKPYSCQDCGTSFARTSSLAVHRRNEHTGEKPYACDKCDAKFARSDYLRKHSHTHAGKAVLQCRDCKGCFTDKKALNYHVRKHHKAQPHT